MQDTPSTPSTSPTPAVPASGAEQPTQTPTPRMLPAPLFRVINPVMKWLLRSPFHGRISKDLTLLTFTGRKSGRQFTTPVGYHRLDGEIVVFTDSGWWRNLTRGAQATLRLQGRDVPVRAQVVKDKDEIVRVYQRIQRSGDEARAKRMRMIYGLDQARPPTDADVRAALETPRRHGHTWRMIRFTPLQS